MTNICRYKLNVYGRIPYKMLEEAVWEIATLERKRSSIEVFHFYKHFIMTNFYANCKTNRSLKGMARLRVFSYNNIPTKKLAFLSH